MGSAPLTRSGTAPWAQHPVLSPPGFWVERTAVHEAAQQGEALRLQQLIESGACVNQVTVDSITPLHAASLQGQAQCVQLLLAAGAQVSRLRSRRPAGRCGCQRGARPRDGRGRKRRDWEPRAGAAVCVKCTLRPVSALVGSPGGQREGMAGGRGPGRHGLPGEPAGPWLRQPG